jgi:branched-chain amino acid transport system ATP-binding protein
MAGSAQVLGVEGLGSGYSGVRVLQDVSFEVGAGEILAIVGRNGVGKTTLMKALMGQLKAYAGSIHFKGENVTRLAPFDRARKGLGYVPQGRGMFTRLSVGDNLRMGEQIGEFSDSGNYERVCNFFPILRERMHQKAGSMSGGEQQQLAIGRVLIGNPALILLDEPSEGIQPNIVQMVGDIVRRLRDETGISVVFVEQNLDLIQRAADRILAMDKGAIVAELTPDQLDQPEIAKKYLGI